MAYRRAGTLGGIVLVVLSGAAFAEEPEWIQAYDEDRIVVRYRDRPELGGRQVSAEAWVEAPPERVFEVLNTPRKYTEFMPYLEKLDVLEELPDGRIQYEVINPPIVSRRDYVLRVTVEKNAAGGRYRIAWRPMAGKGPAASDDAVRVTVNEGSYVLEADGSGTKLTYTLLTHPGGSIPGWIAKRSNTSAVPELIERIRRRSADPSWRPD